MEVGWGSVLEVPGEAGIRGPLPALTRSAHTPPHLMSRNSSSFAGLSKMASRGLTRSSTPPSCTYCRERYYRSHNSRDFQSWVRGNAWAWRDPLRLEKALSIPRLSAGCLILVTN